MPDQFDQKFALDRFRQWHFWWLVVFSFLLIITLVYYLPTRFLQEFATEEAGHGKNKEETSHGSEGGERMTMNDEEMHKRMMEDGEMMMNGHGEMDSTSSLQAGQEERGHEAAYSEENAVKQGLVVNLNVSPVPYNAGVPLNLNFFVNEKPGNVPILASQLQVEHEQLMHVVGLRLDMNEFFHVHPSYLVDNSSTFSTEYIFRKPGFYKIWSSVKKDGVDYTFGHPELNIAGNGLREEKKVSFSRNIITGNYQVSMEMGDTAVKDRGVDLSFDIHTLTGQEVDVENYLGAKMHLVLIRDDWRNFIHTHPDSKGHSNNGIIPVALAHGGIEDEPAGVTGEHQTSSSGDEVISFSMIFPESGLYKAFAQFRPKGINLPPDEALLAEFWIQVEEKAPFPVSQWWGLLVISVVLIAGLSWVVKRYLVVKVEDIMVKK